MNASPNRLPHPTANKKEQQPHPFLSVLASYYPLGPNSGQRISAADISVAVAALSILIRY